MWHEEKQRTARRAPGDNVLQDQFQKVTVVLASDWCQKTCVFFVPTICPWVSEDEASAKRE